MSLDLFVVREEPLTWAEVLRTCDGVAKKIDGLSFWAMTGEPWG